MSLDTLIPLSTRSNRPARQLRSSDESSPARYCRRGDVDPSRFIAGESAVFLDTDSSLYSAYSIVSSHLPCIA